MWPSSLRWLDVTCDTAVENLAFDEALLAEVESDVAAAALRIWEAKQYAVVIGRSNDIDREVNVPFCQADGVPILRRSSGGGAVVLGPGCLCFSLALPIPARFPELGIAGVTRAVMERLAEAFGSATAPVTVSGISDLAANDRKICGNAQRWRRRAFLHHGSLLYDFDLSRVSRYLNHPSRQPDYRRRRTHDDFVANLRRTRGELIDGLRNAWNAGRLES